MADALVEITPEEAFQIISGASAPKPDSSGSDGFGMNLLRTANQGNTLGFGDEITAGLDTGLEGAKSIFGSITGMDTGAPPLSSLGKYYDARLQVERDALKKFAKDNPKTAIAAELTGSIPLAIATGGATAEAPILTGAALGGAAGFGSGEGVQDRLVKASLGAPFGAAASYAIPKVVSGVTQGAGALLDFIDSKLGYARLADQSGKVGGKFTERLTPGEVYTAKQMRDQTAEQLGQAFDQLSTAKETGVPLALADVAGPRTEAKARFLAQYDPSMEATVGKGESFSPRKFLQDRASEQGKRITQSLAELSPEASASEAGQVLKNEAQNTLDSLVQSRADATAPLYGQIGDYPMTKELVDAVSDPIVLRTMEKLRTDPILATRYGSEAGNSPGLMIAARKLLREQASTLGANGEKEAASIVGGAAQKLTSALESQPEFQPANTLYRTMSEPINALEGTQTAKGLAESILKLDRLDTSRAGEKLMQLPAEEITKFKTLLGDRGDKAMRAGVKSYLTDIISSTKENREVASKLLDTPELKDKALAALGETEFNKLMKRLSLEKIVSKGGTKFQVGSPTQSNLAAEQDLLNSAGALAEIAKNPGSPNSYLKPLANFFGLGKGPSDQVAQEAALLMFDPQSGYQFLDESLPLLQKLANRKKAIDATAALLGEFSGPTSAIASSLSNSGSKK